ncbi:hypothetical protein VTJ83DRAFT_5147 [Remersonia thermophila]|uniref:Rhodopsin domain-containing protein n=1 Tax=Remersonia thermophila TaxID=72144 RepID=A0ABR4DCQ3_9PEZI
MPPVSRRGYQLAVVNITALALATTVLALRCYVRAFLLKAFGVDDWLMLAATVFFALYCTASLLGVSHGTGHYVADLTPEEESTARMFWWHCYFTYALTMLFAKMSIAYFFSRITIRKVHRYILIATTVITIISSFSFFFACIFQCWPVSYFWDKRTQSGKCIPDRIIIALATLISAINLLTDATFALMPAWIVSRLNMKLKSKLALVALMGMGCVASAAVLVRMPYLHLIGSDEFLHDSFQVAVWSSVEQGLAITAGCLATLQPLAKLIGHKLGLRPHPSASWRESDHPGSSHRNRAGISVRTEFTHRTEVLDDMADGRGATAGKGDPPELPLGVIAYSATGYSTSEEHLRAGALPILDEVSSKDVERGGRNLREGSKISRAFLGR